MVVKNRETGINVIGALPWGSHLCVFYGTGQDLSDTLVPYFKAGLQNNEFCLWITSNTPGKKSDKAAVNHVMPDFTDYIRTGQLEVVSYKDVYLQDGVFNIQKALNTMADKTKQALDNGYDGLRGIGYVPWFNKEEWLALTKYENEVDKTIENTHTLALCAYPFDKCKASEFIDVMNNHRYAFIVQGGETLALRPKTVREMNQQLTYARTTSLTPLMKRFAISGLKDFEDQEIIELLLSLCPHCTQKHLLPQLNSMFKNIRGLLAASNEELIQSGLDCRCIPYINLFHEIPARVLEEKIKEQPIYNSPQQIADYFYYSMRDLKKEVFKVIFLNAQNQIMEVVDLFEGTSDKIAINAREVVESAIAHNTKSLIFVHNHPSGDPTPSQVDKQTTRDLVFTGNIVQIRVLDHIIIGENRYYSFANEGLIKEYEMDFLNLKLTGTSEAKRRLSRAKLSVGTQVINLILELLFIAGFAYSFSSNFFI